MKIRNYILISILSIFSNAIFSQTFESKKQSYFDKVSGDEIFVDNIRKFILDNNNFSVELPDDSKLDGTLKLSSEKITESGFKQKVYKIDGGGLIALNEDNIFLNLYATHDTAFTLFLENYIEPTEKEKEEEKARIEKSTEEFMHKTHIKMYGELTANCIRDKKIKPGMKKMELLLQYKLKDKIVG